jgi:hypothetical protein
VRARLCGWDGGATSVVGAISVLAVGGGAEFGDGCEAVSEVEEWDVNNIPLLDVPPSFPRLVGRERCH